MPAESLSSRSGGHRDSGFVIRQYARTRQPWRRVARTELADEEPPAPVPESRSLLIVTAGVHVVEAARHLDPWWSAHRDDGTQQGFGATSVRFTLGPKLAHSDKVPGTGGGGLGHALPESRRAPARMEADDRAREPDTAQDAVQILRFRARRVLRSDAQGVVYYGRYMPYFDLARTEYHRHLGRGHLGAHRFAMRAATVEYVAGARFDDLLEIFVRVERIGRTSITYDHAAYRIRTTPKTC